MSHSNPCPGSARYIAHQERVVCGALGEQIRYAVCEECGQRVMVGLDDRLIRHRPASMASITTASKIDVEVPIVIERRTLRERLKGRVA